MGDTTYAGETRDISQGGLSVVAVAALAFGQRVKLRFQLPTGKEPVEVEGEVRWFEGPPGGEQKFGLRFCGLRARDVWAMTKFLQTPPAPVVIPLDERLDPAGNVERLFKKYKKAKKGLEVISSRTAETEREAAYLESAKRGSSRNCGCERVFLQQILKRSAAKRV